MQCQILWPKDQPFKSGIYAPFQHQDPLARRRLLPAAPSAMSRPRPPTMAPDYVSSSTPSCRREHERSPPGLTGGVEQEGNWFYQVLPSLSLAPHPPQGTLASPSSN